MWHYFLLVVLAVGSSCAEGIKCSRYSPEEVYYTVIRPSAVGTFTEMKSYFDALFPRVEVEEMVELMPQIKNEPHNFGNFSRALEFLKKYEYSVLIESEVGLDEAWEAFFHVHRAVLQKEENATITALMAALMGVTEAHELANTKLDEACKELAIFFHGVTDQVVEGLTIFLEEEAAEPIEDERKLAAELQRMIWKKTKSNLLGLVVSRTLHRILNNKQRDVNEPRLLKPVTDAVKKIVNELTSFLKNQDLDSAVSTFWRTQLEELYQRKDLKVSSARHLGKLFKNDEYVAEILIDMMSYY